MNCAHCHTPIRKTNPLSAYEQHADSRGYVHVADGLPHCDHSTLAVPVVAEPER